MTLDASSDPPEGARPDRASAAHDGLRRFQRTVAATARLLVRPLEHTAVKVLVGLIQIYVGLAFFGCIPGLVHAGHVLGIATGCLFICLGIIGAMSPFVDD